MHKGLNMEHFDVMHHAIYIFKNVISFWLCWVFVAMCSLSLVATHRLLIAVSPLVAEHGL